MTYTVAWLPAAERQLAAIWVDAAADDRGLITAATEEIDRRLRTWPEEEGESRPDGRRIIIVAPLNIAFRVLPDDCIVRVIAVWRRK